MLLDTVLTVTRYYIYTLLYSGPVSPITHSDPATRYKPASTIYSTFYNDSATKKLIDILAARTMFVSKMLYSFDY